MIACLLSQQLYMDVVVNEKHSPFLTAKLILIHTTLKRGSMKKKKQKNPEVKA